MNRIVEAAALAKVPNNQIVEVYCEALTPHPRNDEMFGKASVEKDTALANDIQKNGVNNPVVVTGSSCASPPGTLLEGHRRVSLSRACGRQTVLCRVVHDLSADDEVVRAIQSNLGDTLGRQYTEEQLSALERKLGEALGRRQGQRTDLRTVVDCNGSLPPKGDTVSLIAGQAGTSSNSVRDRQKIFSSAVSTEALKEAVNTKLIPRSKAAALVRKVEKEFGREKNGSAVERGRHHIDELVAEHMQRPNKPQRRRKSDQCSEVDSGWPANIAELARQVEQATARFSVAVFKAVKEEAQVLPETLPEDTKSKLECVRASTKRASHALEVYRLVKSLYENKEVS